MGDWARSIPHSFVKIALVFCEARIPTTQLSSLMVEAPSSHEHTASIAASLLHSGPWGARSIMLHVVDTPLSR